MSQARDSGLADGRRAEKWEPSQAPEKPQNEEKHSVTFSAAIFLFGTLLSRLLGLYRDTLIARYLSEDIRDAFLNAFRLPNLFRRVFVEGGLSASFVPVHAQVMATEPEKAKELRSGVFSILLSFAITASLLVILFMDEVMRLLLSGSSYMSVPGKFELTVRLAQIMFGFFILISLYGYFAAILSGGRKFAAVAFAPCLFNIAIVLAAKLSRGSAVSEFAIAWAVLLGGLLQVAFLIPTVIRLRQFPSWSWNWRMPEVVRVMRMILPTLFSLAIPQFVILVNTRFAANLESGTHSYLYLAERILEFPLSLFVVSLGTTLLPTLSRQWSEGDRESMTETINHITRLVIFIALPAAIGLFVLAQPICETLFLGREFKYNDVLATARVIRIYSLALIFWAGTRILSQGFYAIQNMWYPPVAGGVALISHVLFAFALTRSFRLEGLAAASVASAAVHFLMLAVAYNAWIGGFEIRKLLLSLAKFAVCGLALVGAVQAHGPIHQALAGRFRGGRETALLVSIFFSAGTYFLCAYFLRVPEFRETVRAFSKKVSGFLSESRRRSG